MMCCVLKCNYYLNSSNRKVITKVKSLNMGTAKQEECV